MHTVQQQNGRIYLDQASVVGGATDWVSAAPQKTPALAPPDKPSVAVVPFTNMRADPEEEFFAAVITSSAMPSLFRYPSLFVISRNSSFTYKSRSADVKAVGRVGARLPRADRLCNRMIISPAS